MHANDIATLKAAAAILHREGRHDTAKQCAHTAAALAVAAAFGDAIQPKPSRRLQRLI